tara:strand:+ start:8585 stop:9982 length:1398 start_codon:yes stop_codon:yes gene_type:complete
MGREQEHENDVQDDIFYAPLEKSFNRILTPFEEFIHRQTTSGILLMLMAVLAIFLANSHFSQAYDHLKHIPISIGIGAWGVEKSLHHWVNDGLMAIFFFVVGLELKREILVGELADLRKAVLPIAAAVGGMIFPALLYYLFNPEGVPAKGWGIPMATDIAFALGIIALLAHRVPRALITFLVALAIVDDLGAVSVIAIFYTETIALHALSAAGFFFGLLLMFNFGGIRKVTPYLIVAIFLWYALLLSGVHATLAGVLGAFAVPAMPKYNPARFTGRIKALLEKFEQSYKKDANIMKNDELQNIVSSLEHGVLNVQTMSQRLEHQWHMPVAYLIIPIFVLVNAGIPLAFSSFADTLTHPIALGISSGLILGKFIGITGISWIFLKLGFAKLPKGVRFIQIMGVSLLAGIGFTMSIFIAELAFAGQENLLLISKTGIISSSLIAGIVGAIWLLLVSGPGPEQNTSSV